MLSTCVSLLVLWSSLLFTNTTLPDFKESFGIATVSNLSCGNARIGPSNGSFNSSLWSIGISERSLLSCAVDIEMGRVRSRLYTDVDVSPSAVSLLRSSDDQCSNAVFTKDACVFSMTLDNVRLDPPDPMLEALISLLKETIEKNSGVYFCDVLVPHFEDELKNQTVNLPEPLPPFVHGATPLNGSTIFRGLLNILNNLPDILSIRLKATEPSNTTIQLHLNFSHGFEFSKTNMTWNTSGFGFLPEMFQSTLDALFDVPVVWNEAGPFAGAEDLGIKIRTPRPFNMSVDISMYNLTCGTDGFYCSLPCTNGIELLNLRLYGLNEWDRLVVNYIGPFVMQRINELFSSMIIPFCNTTDNRFQIPIKESPDIVSVPPTEVIVPSVLVGFALVFGSTFLSIRKHRKSPVYLLDGSIIPLWRVLLEDTLLILMIVVNALAFLWSNCTTAARIVAGDEVTLLSFSLMETSTNLYKAGLRPFAVLVFIFSGLYPYLKLFTIMTCTLVLQKPESMVLKVIDYFGKLSFLDSYAMVVMSSGLQMEGIADVKIIAGFYVFLAATVLCVFTGNYATTFWRRNTSLRMRSNSIARSMKEVPDEALLLVSLTVNERHVVEMPNTPRSNFRSLFWRVLNALFVAACILPPWITPCLSYRVRGAATLIQPNDRNMTLYELSSASTSLLLTCVFTIGIAPLFYAAFYPRLALLASWGAADAFLLACVAGIFQLERFVEFVIGTNMRSLYTAEARLLWPMIPLLIASVWQWVLAAEHVFGLSEFIRNYRAKPLETPASQMGREEDLLLM
ncbi:putative Paraquat-inducible protein A [Trypanosoma cruzi]|nr:putative Paraquat-inducible protein A [Trypanosoma cruzi]